MTTKMNNDDIAISVVIIARNEETNLEECLKSCTFAKEIILVDDNSTDKTVEIAISFGAKVFTRSLNSNWGAQQTFAIKQATCPWIFLIDADERCSEDLQKEILETVKLGKKRTYLIHRENRFRYYKATHGVLRPDWVQRLMPNEDVTVEGYVHPKIISNYPEQRLKSALLHYTYSDWDQYYRKLNQYCYLAANKYFKNGKRKSFLFSVVINPLWAFVKVYFINLGFLDGKMGFILSANHYSYTLQKYVRLYTLYKSNGKL